MLTRLREDLSLEPTDAKCRIASWVDQPPSGDAPKPWRLMFLSKRNLKPTNMELLNLPAEGSPTQWRRTRARRPFLPRRKAHIYPIVKVYQLRDNPPSGSARRLIFYSKRGGSPGGPRERSYHNQGCGQCDCFGTDQYLEERKGKERKGKERKEGEVRVEDEFKYVAR